MEHISNNELIEARATTHCPLCNSELIITRRENSNSLDWFQKKCPKTIKMWGDEKFIESEFRIQNLQDGVCIVGYDPSSNGTIYIVNNYNRSPKCQVNFTYDRYTLDFFNPKNHIPICRESFDKIIKKKEIYLMMS